jgi:hypothetical protein
MWQDLTVHRRRPSARQRKNCLRGMESIKQPHTRECVGKPFTSGAYPVLVIRSFRGWKLSLADHKLVIRFANGRASFFGEGQDVPPYPC